jgi:uncharacterized protein YjbI with pentapeptide repeats
MMHMQSAIWTVLRAFCLRTGCSLGLCLVMVFLAGCATESQTKMKGVSQPPSRVAQPKPAEPVRAPKPPEKEGGGQGKLVPRPEGKQRKPKYVLYPDPPGEPIDWTDRILTPREIGAYQKKAKLSPKLCPGLINVLAGPDLGFKTRMLTPKAPGKVIPYDPRAPMTLYVRLRNDATGEFLKLFPLQGATSDDKLLVVALTRKEIEAAVAHKDVYMICLPQLALPLVGGVTTEGVSTSFADTLHARGVRGQGTTIVIIDASFDLTNPELSGYINVNDAQRFDPANACAPTGFICDPNEPPGASHGTAVAEVVIDMAPEARIVPYMISGMVGFENAVQAAIDRGDVDVITTSVAFAQLPPFIGIRPEEKPAYHLGGDSPAALALARAVGNRIVVTQAVGNGGRIGWFGQYQPSEIIVPPLLAGQTGATELTNYQSLMEFRPEAPGLQTVCLPIIYDEHGVAAVWNGPNFTPDDYGLFLFNESMTQVMGNSIANDYASDNHIELPFEFFFGPPGDLPGAYDFDGDGEVEFKGCLVLASFDSSEDNIFHVISTQVDKDRLPGYINYGSILTPGDARGILGVGAVRHSDDTLADYSSLGPTDDMRPVPEICGPTEVSTTQYSDPTYYPGGFSGTSAATPHVAGAAALIVQQLPFARPWQVKARLTQEARYNGAYAVANLCGRGSLDLRQATLIRSDWSQANCQAPAGPGVNWSGCNIWENGSLPRDASAVDLTGVDLTGAILIGTNLHAARLHNANLSNANLMGARLRNAELHAANLSGANLSYTDMDTARMEGANATNASFSHAHLAYSTMASNFTNADFTGAWLYRTSFATANLWGANLSETVISFADFLGADLSGANFRDAALLPGDVDNAYARPNVDDVLLEEAGRTCKVENWSVADAPFCVENPWCDFAPFPGMQWQGCAFDGPEPGRTDFRGAALANADLRGADLRGSVFTGADLQGAKLSDTDLSHAVLTGTNLASTDLDTSRLQKAVLTGANLNGAGLQQASLQLSVVTDTETPTATEGADLRCIGGAYCEAITVNCNASIEGEVDLTGCDLTAENLIAVQTSGATMRGVNMRGRTLNGAAFRSSDLTGASLKGVSATTLTLQDSTLIGADLRDATITSGLNLAGADLTGANLSGASLSGNINTNGAILDCFGHTICN